MYTNFPATRRACARIAAKRRLETEMKYAVIASGGKQYRVVEGATIEVDHMPVEINKKVKLDNVLLLVEDDKVQVGTPTIKGLKVQATVVGHEKGEKITVFKYSPKKRIRTKTGHRQQYSQLKIDSIGKE
jgi:large subunit ribosomal protein L21